MNDVMVQLPEFVESDGNWDKVVGDIIDGKIYEMAFNGNDAHGGYREINWSYIFRRFNHEYPQERPCLMTGKMTVEE